MKGSATGLLANLWEETLPKHKAASPASPSTSGWVMRKGCRKSNAIIAISSFVLLHPVASCRCGWSWQLPGCSSIMRVSKGNSASLSSLWTHFCSCSSKTSRTCLPACWKLVDHSPIREHGWHWPWSSPPAEEGLGKLGQILPLLHRAAVFCSSEGSVSLVYCQEWCRRPATDPPFKLV